MAPRRPRRSPRPPASRHRPCAERRANRWPLPDPEPDDACVIRMHIKSLDRRRAPILSVKLAKVVDAAQHVSAGLGLLNTDRLVCSRNGAAF